MRDKLPNCYTCVHHFITYSKGKPYGCRAMNFKSKKSPSLVVYESSGIICQLYSPKKSVQRKSKDSNEKKWIA